MGVQGLWQILEPTGKPVHLHSLRGKVLAVDVSILLHQALKGYRDKDGNPLANAHLLGLFHRICKLLLYGIKPVFVFDGANVPWLKKRTLAARNNRKLAAKDKSDILRQRLLTNFMRQQLKRQVLGGMAPTQRMEEGLKNLLGKRGKEAVASTSSASASSGFDDIQVDLEEFRRRVVEADSKSLEDDDDDSSSSSDEYNRYARMDYSENFDTIVSPNFDSLPLEAQHEILFEMQESRKMNSWGKVDQMPKDLHNFSAFQMDRLVKRRTLQKKIQSVQQEMGQRHIHVQNLDEIVQLQNDLEGCKQDINDDGISSNTIVHAAKDKFIMIKKKDDPSQQSEPEVITVDDDDNCGEISKVKSANLINDESDSSEDSEEERLEKAIKLSLMDSPETSELTVPVEITKCGKSPEPKPGTSLAPKPIISITSSSESDSDFEDVDNTFAITVLKDIEEKARAHKLVQSKIANSRNQETLSISLDLKPRSSKGDMFKDIFEGDNFKEIQELKPIIEETETKRSGQISGVGVSDTPEVLREAPEKINMSSPDIFWVDNREDSLPVDIEMSESAVCEDNTNEVKAYSFPSLRETEQKDLELETDRSAEVASKIPDSLSPKLDFSSNDDQMETQSPNSDVSNEPSFSRRPGIRVISAEYMQDQERLNVEKSLLQSMKGAQERIATSINEQIQVEAKELLELFAIPYVSSPSEAESQCAFLDMACLTEGTITDDSDVWLFGGQRVYKNFFSAGDKNVELFQYKDVVGNLNLDREKMILLAMLTGSDYTEGVEGVGPVTAMEIITEFPTNDIDPFQTLVQFKHWWDEETTSNKKLTPPKNQLRGKLRKLNLDPSFPNKTVYKAYMEPSVDESMEPFRFGNPDLQALKIYCKERFNWDEKRVDGALLPVTKTLCSPSKTSVQPTIDKFLLGYGTSTKRKLKSKRMQRAVKKLKISGASSSSSSGQVNLSEDDDDSEDDSKPKSPKKSSPTRLKKVSKTSSAVNTPAQQKPQSPLKPCSSGSQPQSAPVIHKSPSKPTVHPQRLREERQNEDKKKKALEILKAKVTKM